MANSKISALTSATTPLAGTETLPVVQSSTTKQVSVANLTAGRAVSASSFSANTTNVFAKFSTELTGGNAYLARFNSSNKPAGIYTGGSSGESFFGANLNWSSGNVFNYTLNGLMWYMGDPGGSGTQVVLGLASGTAGNSAGVDTASTVLHRWNTSGDYTLVNGNVVIGTSGKGIDFSATPGTGTSELLNDYEEGTWTPTVTASGLSGVTYSTQSGTYIKVGRLVTVRGRVILSSAGTNSGTYTAIGGLPFSSQNANPLSPASLTWFNLTGGTSGRMPYAMLYNGTTEINLLELDQNGLAVALLFQASRLTNTTEFNIELFYQTA
jgi:hypothetical protein